MTERQKLGEKKKSWAILYTECAGNVNKTGNKI